MSISPISPPVPQVNQMVPPPDTKPATPAPPPATAATPAPTSTDADGDHDGTVGTKINVKA